MVDSYMQLCSHIETQSESIRETQDLNTQSNNEQTDPPKDPDFQSAFLNFVGICGDEIIDSNQNQNQSDSQFLEIDSQTDFESVIKMFLTNNPQWANENTSRVRICYLD